MAHLGGAVDSEACDAGCGGRAYEGGGDGRDVGVLQVAVRVEEPHGGGGARRSLGHDRRLAVYFVAVEAQTVPRWPARRCPVAESFFFLNTSSERVF